MFKDIFCKFPKNCRKKFPRKSISEIMDMVQDETIAKAESISVNRYNEYVIQLMAMFNWAKIDKKRKFLQGENVFVELKKIGEERVSYEPFTTDDLKKFFSHPIFTEKNFEAQYSWQYWVPVLMMYHGTRLEEITQLLLDNITEHFGFWCLDIKDKVDQDGTIITKTKKKG